MRIHVLSVAALCALACGEEKVPFEAKVAAPEAPGFQVVTPEITVAPGQEQIWCSFYPALAEDLLITKVESYQAPGGHHAALYVVNGLAKAGVFRCDTEEAQAAMAAQQWHFLGGGDATNRGDPLPEGVAIKIPKGKTLMVQSHYVAGAAGVFAKDTVNVTAYPKDKAFTLGDYWALGDTDLQIPKGPYQTTGDCEIDSDISVVYVLGHTHERGTLFKLEHFPLASPETPTQLYYQTNGYLLRNDPPRVRYPVDAPLLIKKGDKLRYTCGWENTSDHVMKFPEEMCQALMLYYPSRGGFMLCNKGGLSEIID